MPVLLAVLLLAAPADDVVAAAERAEQELDYDIAKNLWLEALAVPNVPEATKLRAHERLAVLERLLGHETESRSHFQWLLARDPGYRPPPDTPPKVLVFFDFVREATAPTPAPPPAAASATSVTPTAAEPPPVAPGGAPGRAEVRPPPPKEPGPLSAPIDDAEGEGMGFTTLSAIGLGGAALTAGALSALLWIGSAQADAAAAAAPVQVERAALYEARDQSATLAIVAAVAAGALGAGAGAAFLVGGG